MDDLEKLLLSGFLQMDEEEEFADNLWQRRLAMEDKLNIDTISDIILWNYNN